MSNRNTWITKKKRISEQNDSESKAEMKREWEAQVKEYEKEAYLEDEQILWWEKEVTGPLL